MKFFAIILSLLAVVNAVPYHLGVVNTGASALQRHDDGYGNYEFGYNEDHAHGGTFRKEKGGPGYQVGSYGLRDADGRIRVVNYIADAHGFRASVSTNEPGTDVKQDPAATSLTFGHSYDTSHYVPVPPPPSYHSSLSPTSYEHTSTLYSEPSTLYGKSLAPMASSYSYSTSSVFPPESHYLPEQPSYPHQQQAAAPHYGYY